MEYNPLEADEMKHGVRFTWNVVPGSYDNIPVPFASMYTPLKQIDNLAMVQYKPVLCTKCASALNPYCPISYEGHKTWTCCICSTVNAMPQRYSQITPSQLCPELMPEYSTIEYMLRDDHTAPVFLFVVDLSLIPEELTALKRSLSQLLIQLPPETLVGFITYGAHVHVHELGFDLAHKSYAFRGESIPSIEEITQRLSLHFSAQSKPLPSSSSLPSSTPSAQSESVPTSAASNLAAQFIQPLSQCEMQLVSIINGLTPDPHFTNDTITRPLRATGTAVGVASGLLEIAYKHQNAKIITITGGICTTGPGTCASVDLSEPIRTHYDTAKGKAPFYTLASKFYHDLGHRTRSNGHVIDLICCCLDQVGLAEMQALVELTGGCVVLDDSFSRGVFQGSLSKMFAKDDENHLAYAFAADIQVQSSKQLKVAGCVGKVTSLKRGVEMAEAEKYSTGVGGTCLWRIGGLDNRHTVAVFFTVQNSQMSTVAGAQEFAYIQFTCKYKHSNGKVYLRVSTVAKQCVNIKTPMGINLLRNNFDQECALAILTRRALNELKTKPNTDVLRALDKSIIDLYARFLVFPNGTADTQNFSLPPLFQLLPQFVFHLRRSQLMQVFNSSLDETAFFRVTAIHQDVRHTLLMVQPTLICYTPNNPPCPVALDVTAIGADRILLLDTFFHIVVWYGDNIVKWKNAGYQNNPEYSYFADLLRAPLLHAKQSIDERHPTPRYIECVQGGSQARFLMAKLNPSVSHNTMNDAQGEPPIFSDDVTLTQFLTQLKKMVTIEIPKYKYTS